jgi:RNA recognition motif-containing protein
MSEKKKIFVGNLPWKATEDSLKALFETHGKVISVKIINDQYTGKSKGFGFVEMEDADAANNAIRELNEKPYMERNLRVSLAQERPQGAPGGGGGRSSYGDRPERSSRGGFGGSDRGSRFKS